MEFHLPPLPSERGRGEEAPFKQSPATPNRRHTRGAPRDRVRVDCAAFAIALGRAIATALHRARLRCLGRTRVGAPERRAITTSLAGRRRALVDYESPFSASAGSVVAARRAGRQIASRPQAANATVEIARTRGSNGRTP